MRQVCLLLLLHWDFCSELSEPKDMPRAESLRGARKVAVIVQGQTRPVGTKVHNQSWAFKDKELTSSESLLGRVVLD